MRKVQQVHKARRVTLDRKARQERKVLRDQQVQLIRLRDGITIFHSRLLLTWYGKMQDL